MKCTCLLTLVAALLLNSAGCTRKSKAEQLAALDNAYQAGILTEGEYNAKRGAILGPAPAVVETPPPSPSVPAPAAPITTPPPSPAAAVSTPKNPKTPPAEPPATAQSKVSDPGNSNPSSQEPAPSAACEASEPKSREKGMQERFFPMPAAKVKNAAIAAFTTLDFTIRKDTGNVLEATKKRNIGVVVGAGGEKVILHFAKAQRGNQDGTRVTGETKKSFVGRVTQRSWTSAVLAQTGCILDEDVPRR